MQLTSAKEEELEGKSTWAYPFSPRTFYMVCNENYNRRNVMYDDRSNEPRRSLTTKEKITVLKGWAIIIGVGVVSYRFGQRAGTNNSQQ